MRELTFVFVLGCLSFSSVAQTSTTADQPKPEAPKWITERPSCKAYRIGDAKGEGCVRTCDTGLEARCASVALDSPNQPACGCVKAQGLEGVNAFSLCRATKKDAEGHEWASCAISCDKRTVATCVDAAEYPQPGAPLCRCEPKAPPKKP